MMWIGSVVSQGHNIMTPTPNMGIQKRHHGYLPTIDIVHHDNIAQGKTFNNPNFVNKVQHPVVHNYQIDFNTFDIPEAKNSSHIIETIKEVRPDIIPSSEEGIVEASSSGNNMCLRAHKNRRNKRRKHFNKNYKQKKRQDLNEMMDLEEAPLSNSLLEQGCSPKYSQTSFKLCDYIIDKLLPTEMVLNTENIPKKSTSVDLKPLPPCIIQNINNIRHSESEDSFVCFDEKSAIEIPQKPCSRIRQISLCESEDSFIVFDNTDGSTYEDEESESSSNCSGEESETDEEIEDDEDDIEDVPKVPASCSKKVKFADDTSLCQVHPMVKWSYAYQAARKGPWEQHARDRERFQNRIYNTENKLKHIFEPVHRDKVFSNRFGNSSQEF